MGWVRANLRRVRQRLPEIGGQFRQVFGWVRVFENGRLFFPFQKIQSKGLGKKDTWWTANLAGLDKAA
jgi:hypothetical protein